jgi:hypothetical protein
MLHRSKESSVNRFRNWMSPAASLVHNLRFRPLFGALAMGLGLLTVG